MDSEVEGAYVAFEAKVARSIYLDNLSPKVTEAVIRSALDQYGSVAKVELIPNYLETMNTAGSALVEMENSKQAANVIEELNAHPFMLSGMPRPIRALPAEAGMFADRPAKPDSPIQIYWLDPSNGGFEVAQRMKALVRKHEAEAAYLMKRLLKDEEDLSKAQAETLKTTYQKYEMMENVLNEKTSGPLAKYYGMKLTDGFGR